MPRCAMNCWPQTTVRACYLQPIPAHCLISDPMNTEFPSTILTLCSRRWSPSLPGLVLQSVYQRPQPSFSFFDIHMIDKSLEHFVFVPSCCTLDDTLTHCHDNTMRTRQRQDRVGVSSKLILQLSF